VTVVIGVVTVTVVPRRAVTAADVIGVLTVTVAATVAGNVGIRTLGSGTCGSRSFRGNCDDACAAAVDERADAGAAASAMARFDAGFTFTLERSAALR